MSTPRICEVFRSPRKEGMYLYVDRAEGLARVPEPLLTAFGRPESALVLHLHPDRRLANADVEKVLSDIETTGYYVQMPPAETAAEDSEC